MAAAHAGKALVEREMDSEMERDRAWTGLVAGAGLSIAVGVAAVAWVAEGLVWVAACSVLGAVAAAVGDEAENEVDDKVAGTAVGAIGGASVANACQEVVRRISAKDKERR